MQDAQTSAFVKLIVHPVNAENEVVPPFLNAPILFYFAKRLCIGVRPTPVIF